MATFFPKLTSRMVMGVAGLILSHACVQAESIPPSPTGAVTVRRIPAYPMVEAEVSGPMAKVWQAGFRQVARYVTGSQFELQFPLVATYLEYGQKNWEKNSRFVVHLALPAQGPYPEPREMGLRVGDAPTLTVACYAYRGAYNEANFNIALGKIAAYLKQGNIPAIGMPRHLYYSIDGWTPDFWKLSEVQVPIPEHPPDN